MPFQNTNNAASANADTASVNASDSATTPASEPASNPASADQNSNKDSVENFKDLWQTVTENTDNVSQEMPSTVQAVMQETPKTSEEVLNSHIDSLGFGNGVDMTKIMSDLQTGDADSMQGALKTVASQAYRAALTDTNRLMESKINDAVDAAVSRANNNYQGDQLIQRLNNELPFTKDPAVAPIAQGVMSQLIKKGKTPEEAIAGTKSFLTYMNKNSAHDLGLQNSNSARPGSGSYGHGGGTSESDSSSEIDFLELFNGA